MKEISKLISKKRADYNLKSIEFALDRIQDWVNSVRENINEIFPELHKDKLNKTEE